MKIKSQTNLHCLSSMKTLLFILTILLSYNCISAQEKKIEFEIPVEISFKDYKKLPARDHTKVGELSDKEVEPAQNAAAAVIDGEQEEKARFAPVETENKLRVKETDTDAADIKEVSGGENLSDTKDEEDKEKFHWKPALIESGVFLGLQHAFRMTQEKTTRELGGKFFRDWARSVKNLRGWEDGDSFFTNYIAHPGQGGITGRIFINNSDMAKKQEFGKSKKYWESRFKAMAWSAVWSTQFELGPISEASLGNVGLREKRGHSTMSWADLIMTPVGGTGLVIAEDAVDKYFLRNWLEKKTANKITIRIFRSFFTPTTSIANLLRRRPPWSRDNR